MSSKSCFSGDGNVVDWTNDYGFAKKLDHVFSWSDLIGELFDPRTFLVAFHFSIWVASVISIYGSTLFPNAL